MKADSETEEVTPSSEKTTTSVQEEERSTSVSGMYYPPI